MKLEPVFLVAPEPPSPTVSRRSCLVACAVTGLGCAAAGWFGGWALAHSTAPERVRHPNFEWAIELARGPVDRIQQALPAFIVVLYSHPDEQRLWDGVRRAGDALLESPRSSARSRAARVLVQAIESHPRPGFRDAWVERLRRAAGDR